MQKPKPKGTNKRSAEKRRRRKEKLGLATSLRATPIFAVVLARECACLWRSEAMPLVDRQAHV